MKRTIIYGAKFNLSSSFSNHTVWVIGDKSVIVETSYQNLFEFLKNQSLIYNIMTICYIVKNKVEA
jgi:hypothetical protein